MWTCRQTRFLRAWRGLIVRREQTHTRSSLPILHWLTWRTSWKITFLQSVRVFPVLRIGVAWLESSSCFFFGLSLVTDYERKFVLGVATPQDLEVNFFSSELFASDPILFRCRHSSRDAAYRTHHAISILWPTFLRHVPFPYLRLGLLRLGLFCTSTIQLQMSISHLFLVTSVYKI